MKRILSYVLAAALTLGTVSAASAIDVKVSGQWDFAFGWVDTSFQDDGSQDNGVARQRVRTQVNFIASENLQGVLMFEIGDINWGRDAGGKTGPGSGGGLDADGVNVETKRAYLDWLIPQTDISIRMGLQGIAMPSGTGFCNPILSADVAGVVVSAPINDMFAVTAVWARPFDAQEYDNSEHSVSDEMDIFALLLPVTGEGWNVTPWGAYSEIGNASGMYNYVLNYMGVLDVDVSEDGDSTNAWWAGMAVSVDMFDPLTFGFDVMYGHMNRGTVKDAMHGMPGGFDSEIGMEGWLLDARIDYKTDFGTPGIFGWYSTGDDKNDVEDGMYGHMPAVGFDDGFEPTTFGSMGSYGINHGYIVSATYLGTWGVGMQIADVSFMEDLSHVLRVAYIRGTNDHEVAEADAHLPLSGEVIYLTDKDAALEINFEHTYQIYENLSAMLDLGYIHLWMDEDVWDNNNDMSWGETSASNAWKAELAFRYSF